MIDMNLVVIVLKKYTVEDIGDVNFFNVVSKKIYKEYEYMGEKFIVYEYDNDYNQRLSDGRRIKRGDSCLVKVEPVVWLVDEEKDIALSKNILFTGAYELWTIKTEEWKFMRLCNFFDKIFSLEILPTDEYLSKKGKKKESYKDKKSKLSKKQKKILSQLDLDSQRVLQDLEQFTKTTTDRKIICEKLETLKKEILQYQSHLESDESQKLMIKK